MAESDFDSITNGRSLCDANGNIGPNEFCAVMLRELRFYMQNRLTEQGFSEHRTPEDTEFTSLAATKMMLTEQFSLACRVQSLVERLDQKAAYCGGSSTGPLLGNSHPLEEKYAGTVNATEYMQHMKSADLAAEQREAIEAEREATLQAVLRGQEEILRLVRKAGMQEAKNAVVLRRIQDTFHSMHNIPTGSLKEEVSQTGLPVPSNQPTKKSDSNRPTTSSLSGYDVSEVQQDWQSASVPDLSFPSDSQVWPGPIEELPASLGSNRGLGNNESSALPAKPGPNNPRGRRGRRIILHRRPETDNSRSCGTMAPLETDLKAMSFPIHKTDGMETRNRQDGKFFAKVLLPDPQPDIVDHHFADEPELSSVNLDPRRQIGISGLMGTSTENSSISSISAKASKAAAGRGSKDVDGLLGPRLVRVANKTQQVKELLELQDFAGEARPKCSSEQI